MGFWYTRACANKGQKPLQADDLPHRVRRGRRTSIKARRPTHHAFERSATVGDQLAEDSRSSRGWARVGQFVRGPTLACSRSILALPGPVSAPVRQGGSVDTAGSGAKVDTTLFSI